MIGKTWRKEAITDVVILMIGAFLFLTPWIISGYVANTAAIWNAWLSGILIAGLALAALIAYAAWEEWLNFVVGLWVTASPWLLGFSTNAAAHVHALVGLIVVTATGLRLWFAYTTRRASAQHIANPLGRKPPQQSFPTSSPRGQNP